MSTIYDLLKIFILMYSEWNRSGDSRLFSIISIFFPIHFFSYFTGNFAFNFNFNYLFMLMP